MYAMTMRLEGCSCVDKNRCSGILYVNRTGQMLLNIPVTSALRIPLVLTYENRYLNSLSILLHYSRGDKKNNEAKCGGTGLHMQHLGSQEIHKFKASLGCGVYNGIPCQKLIFKW